MKTFFDDTIKNLLSEDNLPVQTPKEGHQQRFLQKLNQQSESRSKKVFGLWKPLSIAATLLILFSVGISVVNSTSQNTGLASVSPEMQQTENYFVSTINKELKALENETTPETEKIFTDALKQMSILEQEYENLKFDLTKSGNDKRVIHAMINNFQNRITLLESVLIQIENVKKLKSTPYETTL